MHYPLPEKQPGKARQRNWRTIRELVYERDSATCHVCGGVVPWSNYECGHIVDRMCGGEDVLSNVVTMCRTCNRLKPAHETRHDYIAWLAAGDWRNSVLERWQVPNNVDLLHIYLGTPEAEEAEKRIRARET